MNTQTQSGKGTQGGAEKVVESVDYRSSAGQAGQEQRSVEVIHESHPKGKATATSGGVLADAAAAAASSLQSAKDAISGK